MPGVLILFNIAYKIIFTMLITYPKYVYLNKKDKLKNGIQDEEREEKKEGKERVE